MVVGWRLQRRVCNKVSPPFCDWAFGISDFLCWTFEQDEMALK